MRRTGKCNFTNTELEVMRLLVEEGLQTKEIAVRMNISVKTAETHRSNIMQKLRNTLNRKPGDRMDVLDVALFAIVHDLVNLGPVYARFGGGIPSPS